MKSYTVTENLCNSDYCTGDGPCPGTQNCPAPTIDTFLYEKQAWILKHLDSASQRLEQSSEKPQISENDRKRYIQLARDIFTQDRILCRIMGVTYGRISIREQKDPLGKLLQH